MTKIIEMKKMTMICMAALLVTAMSCKKEKVENTAVGAGFRATLEAHAGDSKTHLDGLSVKWDLGDAVTVVNANDVVKTFTIGAIHGDYADLVPAEGQEVTDDFYKPNYKAYYPAAIYDAGQVSLPQTQDYAAGSFGKGFNPMAAYAVNKNLDFKNLCGLLALQLTGDCEVKSITITSKNDEMLWGKGELTLSSSAATLSTLTEGGNSITLNCYVNNEYVQLSGTATTFYFVVPAGTLSDGFDVVLTDSDDKVWRRSASQNTTINQNKIRTMSELAVETQPVTPSEVTITMNGCVDCINSVYASVTLPQGSYPCEFGIVYSQSDDTPTIEEGASKIIVHTLSDDAVSGTVYFTADFSVLTDDENYYVRAYAMCDGVAYSSESTIKTVVGGKVPLPLPSTWSNGKNPHPFTVGEGKVVYFSQGNLQYIGSAESPYWKFANHQFDLLGVSTGQNSTDPKVDRDLFGWGTSGINHGANAYCPWNATRVDKNYYAYGDVTKNLCDDPGTADWGYNAISNGGNIQNSGWRTLTAEEGMAMIARKDKNGNVLNGEGKVGSCTPGLIILPDDWDWNKISLSEFAPTWVPGSTSFANNNYSYSDWAKMEAAGAVFLPAAGNRDGTEVDEVGTHGYYWSSTCYSSQFSYNLWFYENVVNQDDQSHRRGYFSVRLVRNN